MADPTQCSILIGYEVPSKGTHELVTNRFYLRGAAGGETPADESVWRAIANNMVSDLADCLSPNARIKFAQCFSHSPQILLHDFTYDAPGAHAIPMHSLDEPGFVCQLMKWRTTARTSNNHPIYLFNFIHGILTDPVTPEVSACASAVDEFGGFLTDGSTHYSFGGVDWVKCGPNGASAVEYLPSTYVTSHDLFS
jgi:hypothetical protein